MSARGVLIGAATACTLILCAWAPPATAGAAKTTAPSQHVVACGLPTTVETPSTFARSNPTRLSSETGLPSGDPGIAKAVKRHVTWLSTVTCKAHPEHTPSPKGHTSSFFTSSNWSGYRTTTTSKPIDVEGNWTVPVVTWASGGSTSNGEYSSIWPGIGLGSKSNILIQAGTESDVLCVPKASSCEAYKYPLYFWFEIYPGEYQQEITNLVPRVGHAVFTESSWASNKFTFLLCDWTSNQCVTGNQSTSATGTTAEWIVERTSYGGSLYVLPAFTPVRMSGSIYEQGSDWEPISGGGGKTIDMYNGSHHLDTTGGLSNYDQNFIVTWLKGI